MRNDNPVGTCLYRFGNRRDQPIEIFARQLLAENAIGRNDFDFGQVPRFLTIVPQQTRQPSALGRKTAVGGYTFNRAARRYKHDAATLSDFFHNGIIILCRKRIVKGNDKIGFSPQSIFSMIKIVFR